MSNLPDNVTGAQIENYWGKEPSARAQDEVVDAQVLFRDLFKLNAAALKRSRMTEVSRYDFASMCDYIGDVLYKQVQDSFEECNEGINGTDWDAFVDAQYAVLKSRIV